MSIIIYIQLFSFSILQGHTQVNFVSTLLRVTMSDQLDLPVRQAGKSKPWYVKVVPEMGNNGLYKARQLESLKTKTEPPLPAGSLRSATSTLIWVMDEF